MSPLTITLVIAASLIALLLTGFPIAFCLISIAVVGYIVFVGPAALYTVFPVTFISITKDIFIAIPLFIFMAAVLQASGLGTALYGMMHKWMASLRGGLAIGTVFACTLIAAMTGLGGTGTVTMGMIAYPEMRARGYEKKMALGCIPTGGALGPLIPPSVPMILVATFGSVSVGKLFMAGVLPGLLCSLFFCIYIGIMCFFNPDLGPSIPLAERANWREKFISLRGAILPLVLILLVLGAIYTGACTPTEAGGMGAAGALVCAAIYRNLSWRNLKDSVIMTLRVNAMVMWIVIGGGAFSSLCGITGVNQLVSEVLAGLPVAPMAVLMIMLVIVLVMGMFLDNTAITIICVPIMIPVIRQIGLDPLWFCLLFSMSVVIGFVTPPFGYNLFYVKGLGHADVTMMDIYWAVMPYVPLMVIALALCIVFPEIVLWLPSMMR